MQYDADEDNDEEEDYEDDDDEEEDDEDEKDDVFSKNHFSPFFILPFLKFILDKNIFLAPSELYKCRCLLVGRSVCLSVCLSHS